MPTLSFLKSTGSPDFTPSVRLSSCSFARCKPTTRTSSILSLAVNGIAARATCMFRCAAKIAAGNFNFSSSGACSRAAAAPSVIASATRLKSVAPIVSSAGEIRKSPAFKDSRDSRMFCSVRMLIICRDTPTIERISLRFNSGELMLTAMTISAPIFRTTSTGRLRVRPPSR